MKVTITIPDELFRRADTAARKSKMRRSQFYAAAISAFLERPEANKITRQLNRIYAREQSGLDLVLQVAQLHSLLRHSE